MLNKVQLIGNVGEDPVLKGDEEKTYVHISIATNKSWFDENNEKVTQTTWHRVSAFNKRAETLSRYLKKGSRVFVEGELTYSEYEKDGERRFATNIIVNNFLFLSPSQNKKNDTPSNAPRPIERNSPANPVTDNSNFSDDDIPF